MERARTARLPALLAAFLIGVVGCGDRGIAEVTTPVATSDRQRSSEAAGTQPPSLADIDISVIPVGPTPPDGPSPYAWSNGPYTLRLGKAADLDGSGSYSRDGFLVKYEWDLDGDGAFDLTTGAARLRHRFRAEYDGALILRVTDSSGRTATASTHLSVSSDGDEEPFSTDNCPAVANHGQEDYDGDGIGDQCDPTPGWPTQDAPGVSEGVS